MISTKLYRMRGYHDMTVCQYGNTSENLPGVMKNRVEEALRLWPTESAELIESFRLWTGNNKELAMHPSAL